MDKIETVETDFFGQVQQHVVVTREDGSQLSMPKAVWDEQQKAAELGGTL